MEEIYCEYRTGVKLTSSYVDQIFHNFFGSTYNKTQYPESQVLGNTLLQQWRAPYRIVFIITLVGLQACESDKQDTTNVMYLLYVPQYAGAIYGNTRLPVKFSYDLFIIPNKQMLICCSSYVLNAHKPFDPDHFLSLYIRRQSNQLIILPSVKINGPRRLNWTCCLLPRKVKTVCSLVRTKN